FVYDNRPDLAVVAPVAATPKATEKTEPIAPAPAAAPPAVTPKDGAGDSVKERILALVVEKTGYPQDMLDLDLDLEADLGVDTVKQAEMFAAIREIYNIPRDENLKLRDYPTLAHVIRFAGNGRSDSAAEPGHEKQAASPSSSIPVTPAPRPILASLDAANSIPRRVPVPKLRPPLTMCKP